MCSKCQSDDAAAPANVWMLTIAESEVLRLRRIEAAAKRVIDAVFDDDAPNLRAHLDALARALVS